MRVKHLSNEIGGGVRTEGGWLAGSVLDVPLRHDRGLQHDLLFRIARHACAKNHATGKPRSGDFGYEAHFLSGLAQTGVHLS